MNKIPCNVIKDLIVLYEDDACSAESRQLVEEHIKECPDCRKLCEESTAPLPKVQMEPVSDDELSSDEKAVKFLKKLKRSQDVRATLIIVLSVLIVWLICAGYTYLSEKNVPAPADSVKVTELYRLKDGSIFCTLKSDKTFTTITVSELLVPAEKRLQSYDNGWYEVSLNTAWWKKLSGNATKNHTASFVFPMTSISQNDLTEGEIIQEGKAIYYTGTDEKDKLILWEDGQKLEPAPDSVEKLVAGEFAGYIDQDSILDSPEVIFRDLP